MWRRPKVSSPLASLCAIPQALAWRPCGCRDILAEPLP